VMYAGKVAEEGPVHRVFTAPRHPYTQKLVSAFPNIRADRRTLDVIPGTPPDLRQPPPGCAFAARCPAVMPVCTEVVPPEVRFSDGVRVACHLYPPGGDALAVAPGITVPATTSTTTSTTTTTAPAGTVDA
jgi:peptide/nickel transport system ATP-binding protein